MRLDSAADGGADGEQGGEDHTIDEGEEGGEKDEGDEDREPEGDTEEADRDGDQHGWHEADCHHSPSVTVDEERHRRPGRHLYLRTSASAYVLKS